jgi:membrane associated rhomboid family serine protease
MLLGQDGNSLIMMIAVLALVFCIFKFIYIAYFLSGLNTNSFYTNIFDWFILPAQVDRIMDRPWTVLTYMFMHDGVFHMLGNVLWLWAFGYILQDLAGNSKLVPLFLYGGIAGAFLFVVTNNLFPALSAQIDGRTLQGASAGVMAIAIATTALAPDYRIFPMLNGGIPLWIVTIIFVIIDFASIPSANGGGHIAHIGGALMGLAFVWQLKKGNDWSAWMNRFFQWTGNLFNPDKKEWKRTARREHHYKTKGTQPYKKVSNVTQKRIDEILDKINSQGFIFLTDEEKDILKRASEDEPL